MLEARGAACLSLQRERQAWGETMFREPGSTGIVSGVRFRSPSPTPTSAESFDSTNSARIRQERRQIIELGKDSSYSTGEGLLLELHAVIRRKQENRQFRHGCFEFLSQLQSAHVWQ